MAITLVNLGTQASTAGSGDLTPALPTGHTTDDLLVVIVACRDSESQTYTFPAGWTERSINFGDDAWSSIAIWYKVHDGSESNPTISVTAADFGWVAQIAAYRGVDTSDPWDIAATVENVSASGSTTFTPSDVTTTTDNAWVLSIVSHGDANTLSLNTAQGFTFRWGTAGDNVATGLADKEEATFGTVTMPTWEATASAFWIGMGDAISPSADGIIPQVMHHRKMMGVS